MVVPTVENIKAWSSLDFATLGFDDDDLARLLARAVAYVEQVTGRVPLATAVPDELASIGEEAVQRRVEQLALGGTTDSVTSGAVDDDVLSFSVPGYSETRRDRSRVEVKAGVTNLWAALWDLLWLLMTSEKRDEWIADRTGVNPPAMAVTEIDWTRTRWGDW